ncbi:hypothetical protein AAHH78_35630, partial [Burkholderia pseudomallei]
MLHRQNHTEAHVHKHKNRNITNKQITINIINTDTSVLTSKTPASSHTEIYRYSYLNFNTQLTNNEKIKQLFT